MRKQTMFNKELSNVEKFQRLKKIKKIINVKKQYYSLKLLMINLI